MADTPDAPETPTTKRRRATRASKPSAPAAQGTRKRESKATPAPTENASVPAKRVAPPKPRSTKRATPAPKPRAVAAEADKSTLSRLADRIGGRWGTAAIAAAGGAAVAALLTLRGSTPKPPAKLPATAPEPSPTGAAHQADGTDSTASFEAGIADEGTIPG